MFYFLCKCIICNYWYLFDTSFTFQPEVCNSCHNLIQKPMNFDNVAIVAIVTIKGNDIEFIFCIRVKMKEEMIIDFSFCI